MPLPGSLSKIPGTKAAKLRRKADVAYDASHPPSNLIPGEGRWATAKKEGIAKDDILRCRYSG